MNVSTDIDAEDVAHEMALEGEWAMDVLASLATGSARVGGRAKIISAIADGNAGSAWHKDVPAFLRELADAIEAVK